MASKMAEGEKMESSLQESSSANSQIRSKSNVEPTLLSEVQGIIDNPDFAILKSRYAEILSCFPENYEATVSVLQDVLDPSEIWEIVSANFGHNQKILNALIMKINSKEDIFDFCDNLEEIPEASPLLLFLIEQLRKDLIEVLQSTPTPAADLKTPPTSERELERNKPPEYYVFVKHYSALCAVLKNSDLLQYFVSESVITLSELDEISAISSPANQVEMLLRKISAPLEAGLTNSFNKLLVIMKSNGNEATKDLSVQMSKSLLFPHSDDDTPPEYHVFRKKYSALVDTLKTTDLYRYFVSEEIITLAEKEEISAESSPIKKIEMMLNKVSSPLESGFTKSFYAMLEVMASYGNRATKELARNINETLHGSVSDDGQPAAIQEVPIFTSPVQTSIEFAAVVSDIAEELDDSCVGNKLEKIKLFCTHTTDGYNTPIFSPTEIDTIKNSKSIFDIFDVIRPHWSWHSHYLLPVIIKRVGSSNASQLLKKFEVKIKYNTKLKEINEMFIKWKKPIPPDYCKMVGIVDKDYDEIVLEDCFKIDTYISETLGQFQCIEYNKHASVEFVWLVPVVAVERLRVKAAFLKEYFKKRLFISLEMQGVSIFDCRIATLEDQKTTILQDKQLSTPSDMTKPFIDEDGYLMAYVQCMIIDTHDSQYKDIIKAVPMEKAADSSTGDTATIISDVRKDVEVIQGYIERDPLKQLYSIHDDSKSQKSKQFYLQSIEKLFQRCTAIGGAMIYYTGYGEEGTGNWCFKDGSITFQDIFDLYNKYLKGKLLYINIDCSYSGQWLVECAKCLDEMGIGACGHHTREQGILIKVNASCQPHQKATNGSYVTQEGVFYDETWNGMAVWYNKKLSDTQTTYGYDFTRHTCLKTHSSPCQLPNVSSSCSWKWKDVIDIDYHVKQSNYIYLVHGKDRGRPSWHYVMVKSNLDEKFLEKIKTGTVDVAQFAHVIESGWGEDPCHLTDVKFRNFHGKHMLCGKIFKDQPTTTSQDKPQLKLPDLNKPFINVLHECLVGFMQCMIIDTNGSKYKDTINAIPMEKAADSSTGDTASIASDVRKDIEAIQGYIKQNPLTQLYSIHVDSKSQKSKQFYLDSIEELFKKCQAIGGAQIYYTGYGEESTGNWCFKDGTITFQDVFTLYNKHLKGKILSIYNDSSYSGQWVVECAKCLDEMGIGACGHQTRKQGILIKVCASCQPHQKATSRDFVTQEGIYYHETWNSMAVWTNKILSHTQTLYACDFTNIKCLQLEGPTSPCRLPDIPAKFSWKWKDVLEIDSKNTPSCHLVRGTDKGIPAWYYVLVGKELEEKFLAQVASGTINVAEYGYVIKSGWGKDPPDDVKYSIEKYFL